MRTIIKYTQFFIYTENPKKCFCAKFEDGINIIYGANTSGKSSVLQAINYTFGINDEKHKLNEILQEKPIFRIDFEVTRDSMEKVVIIRDDEFVYIKRGDLPIKKFLGISGSSSAEHIDLKKYISEIFGFNMMVESNGEIQSASIEAMFLPYYVSQDYGWVLEGLISILILRILIMTIIWASIMNMIEVKSIN